MMRIWISALLSGLMLIGGAVALMAQSAEDTQPDPKQPRPGQYRRGWGGPDNKGQPQPGRKFKRDGRGRPQMTPEQQEKMKQWRKMMIASRAIYIVIDTNKDGELSSQEIENATANLKKLDTDKDSKVSTEELTKAIPDDMRRGPRRPGGPGAKGNRRGPRDGSGRGNNSKGPRKDIPIYRPVENK